MDWYQLVFELIDMRSFSNLWYWIALAVAWSSASHWVLGVPNDLIQRARRRGGQAMADVEDLARLNTRRTLYVQETGGLWLLGIASAFLTTLGILGFGYRVEFAQAVFLIAFPMSIVGIMRIRVARLIARDSITGEALCRRLLRHRFGIQLLGVVSIFVTAVYGMYQNMSVSPLSP